MRVTRNKNYLGKDGLIYNIYIGDQTVASLEAAEKELQNLTKKLRSQNRSVLIFTDITELGHTPTIVRQKGLEIIRNLDYDKVALFGNEGPGLQIARLVINVSMMGYKIKAFNNKEDAKNWLLGN